jgi:hypothetical protein
MNFHLRSNYPTREIGRQIDYEALKRNGYRDQGIVVVKLDDQRLNDFERQFLKNIGGKLYGSN